MHQQYSTCFLLTNSLEKREGGGEGGKMVKEEEIVRKKKLSYLDIYYKTQMNRQIHGKCLNFSLGHPCKGREGKGGGEGKKKDKKKGKKKRQEEGEKNSPGKSNH